MKVNNISLKKVEYEDSLKLKEWGEYEDPIFMGYNYNKLTENESKYWFVSKQKMFNSKYFSINLDDKMIGYVGVKEINSLKKTGKLGIVFDPNFVSKGYGKIAMKIFLDYYFNTLKMKKIVLEVNSWNHRAIKLYEHYGFEIYKENYQYFENQNLDLKDKKYEYIRDEFKVENTNLYSRIYFMKLTKETYESRT